MDHKTCDICGKPEFGLCDLSSIYATDDIKKVCAGCDIEVSGQLRKLQDITFKTNEHWLKKFMVNLKKKLSSK